MKWRFNPPWRNETRIVASSRDPFWQRCEHLEFKVFSDCQYIQGNGLQRIHAFDRYQRSVFVASGCGQDDISGVIRLIFNNGRDMKKSYFPTLSGARLIHRSDGGRAASENNSDRLLIYKDRYTADLLSLPADGCVDVSTMSVLPEKRDASISRSLITRAILLAWEMSVRYALGAIDTRFLEKLLSRGLPFVPIGPSVPYWGSPTTPVLMDTYRIPKGVGRMMIQIMKFKAMIGGTI
ncbi:MAG TPA: hypothetical protein DHV36_01325 [Desulfobacteraceae bacterium]|nr:hypothetical protein [Desulfobacteraceae bacterium]